jgi:hypothetical protein
MSGGVPGCLVLNIGTETMGEGRKEGIDGLLLGKRTSGPRKEGKRRADYRGTGAKKRPLGASKGLGGGGLDLFTVPG